MQQEMLVGGSVEAGKDMASMMGLRTGENIKVKGKSEMAPLHSNYSESA